MELPFTVVYEPPSRAELRALLRMRRTWAAAALVALAIGTAAVLAGGGHGRAFANGTSVPVELTSRPAGATVWLDGRERGRTPLTIPVVEGKHRVIFKAPGGVDSPYAIQVGVEPLALDGVLWRRQPTLERLRPALPGATLADVRLLANGELALVMGLPTGHQLQMWRLDPRSGALEPALTDVSGSRLAIAVDGQHVAAIGYAVGPAATGADTWAGSAAGPSVLWLTFADHPGSGSGWQPPLAAGEQLVDASWSPRADRLLVVSQQAQPGGTTTSRLWVVDAGGRSGGEVLSLPSEVALGTETWSPDGQHIALVAHAGTLNALCLMDLDGSVRYLADLEASPGPPPAYLPATWSADGQQLAFVAAHQHPPGVVSGWLQPDPKRALYVASVADPALRLLGDTDMDSVAWREDGQLVGLGRLGTNRILGVRLLDDSPSGQPLLDLPLSPGPSYAAVWDLAKARLLLASPTSSGRLDYWLATFDLEGQP